MSGEWTGKSTGAVIAGLLGSALGSGPTMRIHDAQMNALRNGLATAKILPAMEPNRDFFIGRNPT